MGSYSCGGASWYSSGTLSSLSKSSNRHTVHVCALSILKPFVCSFAAAASCCAAAEKGIRQQETSLACQAAVGFQVLVPTTRAVGGGALDHQAPLLCQHHTPPISNSQ